GGGGQGGDVAAGAGEPGDGQGRPLGEPVLGVVEEEGGVGVDGLDESAAEGPAAEYARPAAQPVALVAAEQFVLAGGQLLGAAHLLRGARHQGGQLDLD